MNRSRSNREFVEDLELRLGPPFFLKGGMLATNCLRGCPSNLITTEDDNDMQIFPGYPREAARFFPHTSSWVPIIAEEDLELRLGFGAPFRYSGSSNGAINISEDGLRDSKTWKCAKASNCHCSDSKKVKLRCSICLDTMKEETSTVCGHIFCKACITTAILVQKKCPTCRVKLSISNIHRIYLPGQ